MRALLFCFVLLTGICFTTNNNNNYKIFILEGSDWCANCINLDKNVLSDSTFIHFINEQNIDLIRVNFPQRLKLTKEEIAYNESIAEKYNFEGVFPTIILAKDESDFDKFNYDSESTEQLISKIEALLE